MIATRTSADSTRPRSGSGAMPGTIRWVALGDSLTAGAREGEPTWASLLAGRLRTRHRLELTNLAVAGARVEDVEVGQLPTALEQRPGLVTLICGGNDVIGSVRPDLDAVANRLERMATAIETGLRGVRLVTATYPAVGSASLGPRTRRRVREGIEGLNELIAALADRHGMRCVDLAAHPGRDDDANYAADGIHPSRAGHRAAATALGEAIETEIEAIHQEER